MVIVARALDKAGYVLDASDGPEFSDTAEVADYAKDAVQMLTASGIIAGAVSYTHLDVYKRQNTVWAHLIAMLQQRRGTKRQRLGLPIFQKRASIA